MLLKKISTLTLRFWWAILLVSVGLTVGAVYKIQDLQFKSDFLDLLPSTYESIQNLDEIKKRVGGEGYLIIVFEGGNLEKIENFTEKLVPELEKFKEITYVDYKFDKEFFESRNLLFIDANDLKTLISRLEKKIRYERNRLNPFYIDLLDEKDAFTVEDIKEKYTGAYTKAYYVSENPQRVILLAKPTGYASDLEFSKNLIQKTNALIQNMGLSAIDPNVKVRFTGRYVTQLEESEFMFEDLKRTSVIAIFGILLLMTLYTRRKMAAVLIGIPLLLSILYSLAFAALTIGYLNIVSSILIGVLAGLGIDFGIHLYLRYLEERRRGVNLQVAIHTIQSSTGKPVTLAGLTTAVAFLVLSPSHFMGFAQFGWVCGSGVLICLMNSYFLLPSLLILQEKIRPTHPANHRVSDVIYTHFHSRKYPKPVWTLAAGASFMVISILGLFFVKFDYDFRKLSADKNGTLALQEEISDYFGISLSPTVVYAQNEKDLPKLTRIMEAVKAKHPNSTIQKGLSLYSYVPENQKEKIPLIRKLGELANDKVLNLAEDAEAKEIENLKKWSKVEPFGIRDLPALLQEQYSAINGYPGSFLFIFPGVDLWEGEKVIRFSNEILEFQRQAKAMNTITASEAVIFADILNLIQTEGPLALLASLLAVFLLLWIDLKRLSKVFYVTLPLLIGTLGLIGLMFIFNFHLNFMNCVIFPILLGMGIDSGLHIYHRYQEQGPGSLRFVIRHTGSAIFLSAATTIMGFGALIFAYHRGMASFGWLAILGIGSCLITSITVLPAILQIMEDRNYKKISPNEKQKIAA